MTAGPTNMQHCDLAIVGAGAAGLFAAIHAGRARQSGDGLSIIAIDSAKKLGAKILVAGGGRCNVTHHAVDASNYAGTSRHSIRNVLGRFDVPRTIEFFADLGVTLKRENTGKLFPTTDDAHTVLDALLQACRDAGVRLLHPWRVADIQRSEHGGFRILADDHSLGAIEARRVILATGGKSLPRTGSDGRGLEIARALGHSITQHVDPALVPLLLPKDHPLTTLSGIAVPATVSVQPDRALGKAAEPASFTNSLLFTHFGLSGPAALDISRYWTRARHAAEALGVAVPPLLLNLCPGLDFEAVDRAIVSARGMGVQRWLIEQAPRTQAVPDLPDRGMPERLARVLLHESGIEPGTAIHTLPREPRRQLATLLTTMPLPVQGDRGYTFAEVTAGGVPLTEVHLATLESRRQPGLHLCGEILDCDGRIGGFNFQWAWASGFVAGSAAADALAAMASPTPQPPVQPPLQPEGRPPA